MSALKNAEKTKASRTKIIKKPKSKGAPVSQEHAGLAQLRRVLGEAMPEHERGGLLPPKQLAQMVGVNVETARSLVYGRLDFRRDTPISRTFVAGLGIAFGVDPSIREHTDPDKAILGFDGKPYTAETYRQWREATNDHRTGLRFGKLLGVGVAGGPEPELFEPLPEQAHTLLDRIFRVIRREHDYTRDLVACNLLKQALFGVADDLGIMKSLQQEMSALRPKGDRPLFSQGTSAVEFSHETGVVACAEIDIRDPDKPWIQVTSGSGAMERALNKAAAAYQAHRAKAHGSRDRQ